MSYEAYQPTKWEQRIDAAFGLVSPKVALNRMVNREHANYFRYLSAQPTTARSNAPSTTPGEWLKVQREKLQIMWNAIMMVDNSGLCSGILIKFPTYICGTLRWQARTGDKGVNAQYQQYIREKTTKPGNIDVTRRHSLRQMCMLDVKSIALKGDVGTNIVREDDKELYLQGIEADRIGDPYRWTTSERYVRGLELDDVGAITGVRVYHQERRSGLYKYDDTYPARDPKSGLPSFLFFTNPIDFDNYRGVSLFKHAIDNSTYIDRMREYELQALLWAASQSGVYYTKSGTLPEALPFNQAPLVDSQGNTIDTYQTRPNTITALSADGERVEMFQHDRPSPNVIAMYENTVIDIAIGAGLTKGFVYDMAGLTGPAVRQCSAQDARAIQIWQEMLREQKLDQVIMLLLGDAIAKKELPYHPNWLMWDWFFPAKPTIDVGRESDANIEEINAGVNTGANVVAEAGLGDVQDVITQRSHEVEMMIDAAQEVAKSKNLPWEQVYALMIPPPRGRGQSGGMPKAAEMAGAIADRSTNRDKPGATDDGVSLNGDGDRNGFGLKKNDHQCLSISTAQGDIEIFYDPGQARDDKGKFTDEGKGSESPGYVHPGDGGAALKEDTGDEAPKIGEPFLVYRVGRGHPLKNDNAGNSVAVAMHLAAIDDIEAPQPAGGTGDRVAAYKIVPHEKWGPYHGFVSGEPENEQVSKIGRDADKTTVVYSFPKGAGYTAEKVAEVPLTDIRAKLKEISGHDNFDEAGAITGSKAIQKAFEGKIKHETAKAKSNTNATVPRRKTKSAKAPEEPETDEEGQDVSYLSKTEKGWLKEFKAKQKAFEKETGKKGLRYDAELTGERTSSEDIMGHIDAVADMQVKNLVARGMDKKAKYGGPQDFVRSEGHEFDLPDSPPQIKLMTPKECYSNATRMMLDNPTKYDYVEGYYVSPHLPFPVEHAWLVDKNTGTVVDPTLGWQPKARYVGVVFPKKFVIQKMVQNKYYGIMSNGSMVNDVVLGLDKDFPYAKHK